MQVIGAERQRLRKLGESLDHYVDGVGCVDLDDGLVQDYVAGFDTDITTCADVPFAEIDGRKACDYEVAKAACCQSCGGGRREVAMASELRHGRALSSKVACPSPPAVPPPNCRSLGPHVC